MKKILASGLVLAAAAVASAQTVTFTNNVMAPSGSLPGTYTLDLLYTVAAADDWTTSGIEALAMAGTSFYYAPIFSDPNNTSVGTAPGNGSDADRFSTFVSLPRGATATGRFTTAAALAGSYKPASLTAVVEPTEFDIAWLEFPPVTTSLDTNAAIARLTLNLGPWAGETIDFTNDPGDTQIAAIELAVSTTLSGGLKLSTLNLYATPEPASLALLALGGLLGLRRR